MSVVLNTTIGPVTLKEMFEGYEAGIDLNRGPFINKQYLAPTWASTFPSINALMGGGVPPVGRHICPESPNLRCLNATTKPRGEFDARTDGRPEFNLPVIYAAYAIPTWEELNTDDPEGKQSFPNEIEPGQPYVYMEQSIDFGTEVIKSPGRVYAFPSDGTALDYPFHRSVAVAQFTLVRRWQDELPTNNVTTYLNTVNTATFLGQPRGQILFLKARTRKTASTDGTKTQEVEYAFKWREFDHNKFHRPDLNTFELIADSGGNNPLRYTDLTQLLR